MSAGISPNRLKSLRLRRNLSREDLAFEVRRRPCGDAKPNAATIRRWERGLNKPHSDVVPALAAALGVTIDELFRADEDEEEAAAVRKERALHTIDGALHELAEAAVSEVAGVVA